MEKPNSLSRISYVILPSEPSVVTAKAEEISVVSVAAVFKSPPTPASVSSAVVPTQVSEVETLVVPLEERIEEVSVNSSPNQVSEFSYIAKPLEVSEVSAFGGVQLPDQISEINIQSSPIRPEVFSATEAQIWNVSRVNVRVFYEAPPEVDIVSTSLLVAPNEPDTVSTELKMAQPTEVLVEYTPNSVLEESIIAGSQPKDVQLVEALSSSISEVDEVSVSYTPASASVISVSYTTNDTSVPVVEYSSNSVSTVEVDRSPVVPSEVSSGYIPYDVDSVNSEVTPSTALDIHPGYITYEYRQAVLHDIDNDLVTLASNPLKDRTRGRPAIFCTNDNGKFRIYVDSEGDAYALGKTIWGTEYTSWTKILDGVKSVYMVDRLTTQDSYLFLKENSELWGWGRGIYGRLLSGNQSDQPTPIKVQENIKDVYYSGYDTVLALKNDGTLIGAGNNFYNVLNTGTRSWQYSVVTVTSNVKEAVIKASNRIYILKNDNYIYVNGGVIGPSHNDYSQLHQFRGNISEIFHDTFLGGTNITYTYLNNSTHYRFSDYIKDPWGNWHYQEAATGYSNVRYIDKSINNVIIAVHTDQGITFRTDSLTDTIPYTGGTFGNVKYMILGDGGSHAIVRTDNTYVEVDNLLSKTADSDNITSLEIATLHTFPKYPIEVSNETDPLPVSVISTSVGPSEVESVDAGAFPEQPIETSIESTPSSVSVISSVTLPSEVVSVEIELNPLKEGDLNETFGLDALYHFVPEQNITRPIRYSHSSLSSTASINHSEYGYLNGRKTFITGPDTYENGISTTRINGITGLERGVNTNYRFRACITILFKHTVTGTVDDIFYCRDGGGFNSYSYRLFRMEDGEYRLNILDSWEEGSTLALLANGIFLDEGWNIIQITPGAVTTFNGSNFTMTGAGSLSVNGSTVWTASPEDAYPYGTSHTNVRVAMNHIEFGPNVEIGDFVISKGSYTNTAGSGYTISEQLIEDVGYIAHKYSLNHLLPDTHPYRFDEPDGMLYQVPQVNEISVETSPNPVSTVECLTAPLEVQEVASLNLEFTDITSFAEVYCDNLYYQADYQPWGDYAIPPFILSMEAHEDRDGVTSNFREPLISPGMKEGSYGIRFAEPTYLHEQAILEYATFKTPDPRYGTIQFYSGGPIYPTYAWDIGDVKFSGVFRPTTNVYYGEEIIDHVKIRGKIKLASIRPFTTWDALTYGDDYNTVRFDVPTNVFYDTPTIESYTLGYPEDGTGFGCFYTLELDVSFIMRNYASTFGACFKAYISSFGNIYVRINGNSVADIDSDGDGEADSYDYFYTDPEDTVRKVELDTYNVQSSPLEDWDYIRCNITPDSSNSSTGLEAGEYYLVGDVHNDGRKAISKDGIVVTSEGQLIFIHPDERGDIWDKVANTPNTLSSVSAGIMPANISSDVLVSHSPNSISDVSASDWPTAEDWAEINHLVPVPNSTGPATIDMDVFSQGTTSLQLIGVLSGAVIGANATSSSGVPTGCENISAINGYSYINVGNSRATCARSNTIPFIHGEKVLWRSFNGQIVTSPATPDYRLEPFNYPGTSTEFWLYPTWTSPEGGALYFDKLEDGKMYFTFDTDNADQIHLNTFPIAAPNEVSIVDGNFPEGTSGRTETFSDYPFYVYGGTKNLEMIYCAPGTFLMGSPDTEVGRAGDEHQHEVTLTKGFYLGKYEVTQAQYQAIMLGNSDGLNNRPSYFINNPDRPVEQVSFDDVQKFIARLNSQQAGNLPEGWAYGLPTEAQWEYACRAGTNTVYSWGDHYNYNLANYSGDSFPHTTDVGQYPPNRWGFYDMHGNVNELCSNYLYGYTTTGTYNTIDPDGPSTGTYRMRRGGDYDDTRLDIRAANRATILPDSRRSTLGFRVALIQI